LQHGKKEQSKMKLKICGLKNRENVQSLLAVQPEYLGFIFYEKSPRFAGEPAALTWLKQLPLSVKKVGVFVNASPEHMLKIASQTGISALQLHGEESPAVCKILKNSNLEIWKAFGVNEAFDFAKTADYAGCCDAFLFDTKGHKRGGNGVAFDWSLLEQYPQPTPFFLSGGIGPNDAAAVAELASSPRLGQWLLGVDINSRFEIEPGLKDVEAVKRFKHDLFS
jgi:phosphoribosylanthranilate isomerase